MLQEITELTGNEPGPTSVILAGIHGNEPHGVVALENIVPNLTIQKGKVIFAIGNPRALEQGVRETDANLNRMFTEDEHLSPEAQASYEYERAQFLKQYIDQAEFLLDVHASRSPESEPFIICTNTAKELIPYIPIKRVVTGFDLLEPGATEDYVNRRGGVGITIECGYIKDPTCVNVAERSVMAFLGSVGHIENTFPEQVHTYINLFTLYRPKTDSFRLTKEFGDFEFVEAGTIIGVDGEEEIRAEKDSCTIFARNKNKVGSEAFFLGEATEGVV